MINAKNHRRTHRISFINKRPLTASATCHGTETMHYFIIYRRSKSRRSDAESKSTNTAAFSVEGALGASEIPAVGTPSPPAKVYSEFGRRCNTRLSHIWYYASRFGLLLTRSYVRCLGWRARAVFIFVFGLTGYENNFASAQERRNARTALTCLCYITGVIVRIDKICRLLSYSSIFATAFPHFRNFA